MFLVKTLDFSRKSSEFSADFNDDISDTISPLSEQSLSSPVEDTGGYQSEVNVLASCCYLLNDMEWIPIRGYFLYFLTFKCRFISSVIVLLFNMYIDLNVFQN